MMYAFFTVYLLVIAFALIVGITTCFTYKWFTPEQGLKAGYVIVLGGITFGPVCSMVLATPG